jgi:hypothetical protein
MKDSKKHIPIHFRSRDRAALPTKHLTRVYQQKPTVSNPFRIHNQQRGFRTSLYITVPCDLSCFPTFSPGLCTTLLDLTQFPSHSPVLQVQADLSSSRSSLEMKKLSMYSISLQKLEQSSRSFEDVGGYKLT